MKSYGQFCPVAKAAELFCEKWTPLIIRDLAGGASRFSELRRGVPLMSPTLLSRRLKQLEAEGVIEKRPASGTRGHSYHLTEAGRDFVPLVEGLGIWGLHWSRRQLLEHEVDFGLLIWALERSVDATAFGAGRTIVRLEFTDQPSAKQFCWFVNDTGKCELCVKDPGYEVDLYLACTLPDMIYVVRGDLPLSRAIDCERLEVLGPRKLRSRLRRWLNLAPTAMIRPKDPSKAIA